MSAKSAASSIEVEVCASMRIELVELRLRGIVVRQFRRHVPSGR